VKTLRFVLCIAMVAVLEWSHAGSAKTNTLPARTSVPYIASRHDAVRDMLWLADVGKDDVVYDLGSGDGRIVIAAVRDFGARRAVGIEIDPNLVRQSRENARKAGVTEKVEFIKGDLFTNDFRQASVVTLFLGHEPNIKLRPRMLRILKPGTRIVSHQFGMGEWQPDKTLTVRTVLLGMYATLARPFDHNPQVPDYIGNETRCGVNDKVFMWVVPAPVAGIWRGKIETEQGTQDLELTLYQSLARVSGTFELITGRDNPAGDVFVDLWGDHVRFWCRPGNMEYGWFVIRFDGHVHGDQMRGTLAVSRRDQTKQYQWQGQRDKADLTGTWEWPWATGPRSVGLRIERREGRLVARYLDGGQEFPVTDFYDFGGGFYFTFPVGRVGNRWRGTDDTGWLIGEGTIVRGELKGTIRFYPYEGRTTVPVSRVWSKKSAASGDSEPNIQTD